MCHISILTTVFHPLNNKWWPSDASPSPQSLSASPTVSDCPRTLTTLNSLTLITALFNPSLQQSNHSRDTDRLALLPLSLIKFLARYWSKSLIATLWVWSMFFLNIDFLSSISSFFLCLIIVMCFDHVLSYGQLALIHPDHANRQSTELAWQIPIAAYTVLRLLMMDSRSLRNMQSTLSK